MSQLATVLTYTPQNSSPLLGGQAPSDLAATGCAPEGIGLSHPPSAPPRPSPHHRATIRRPGALAEEPGVIDGDVYRQVLARARILIDMLGAEARRDR